VFYSLGFYRGDGRVMALSLLICVSTVYPIFRPVSILDSNALLLFVFRFIEIAFF